MDPQRSPYTKILLRGWPSDSYGAKVEAATPLVLLYGCTQSGENDGRRRSVVKIQQDGGTILEKLKVT